MQIVLNFINQHLVTLLFSIIITIMLGILIASFRAEINDYRRLQSDIVNKRKLTDPHTLRLINAVNLFNYKNSKRHNLKRKNHVK